MATTHALFVGINNYHPQSGVSNLAGCVNDVQAFRDFITKNYQNVLTHTLLNEQATRDHIIQAFTDHLINKAKAGDQVLFYYAGHGSYATSAEVFKQYDPKQQDETFVCYDSRLPGHYDLTDKEMAVLLSRIPNDVSTIIIADSCHSASVTRNGAARLHLGLNRFTEGRSEERSLSSYLLEGDNFYQDQLTTNGTLSIPHSKHLLLSACERDEEAWETTNRRGLFSAVLLETLEKNRNISYTDLFEQVRHKVYNTAENQQPTIYPLDGFNPNTLFLQKEVLPNRKRHLIQYKNGDWRLAYGGIHGLPTLPFLLSKISIGIYEEIEEVAQSLGQASVSKILLNESILANVDQLDIAKIYWGEIETFPTSMLVNLEGRPHHIAKFLKKYRANPSPFIQFIEGYKEAPYTLKVWSRKLEILYTDTRKLLHGKRGMSVAAAQYIVQQLEHIQEWENIASLSNQEVNRELLQSIQLQFFEEQANGDLLEHQDHPVIIDYWKAAEDKDEQGNPKPIWYQIHATNTGKKDLYVALLYLSSSFEIQLHFKSQKIPANSKTIVLDKDHGLLIKDKNIHQTTDIFKVIVSTEPFDDHKFQLNKIELGATKAITKRPAALPQEDWCTQTITVNTIRKQSTIGDKAIAFQGEGITITAPSAFKADIAFTALNAPTASRSLQPSLGLHNIRKGEHFELLSLSKPNTRRRHYQDKSIIELSGIQNKAALKKQPLELTVHQKLGANENIIPVTFKDGFLIPFGETSKTKDGKAHIIIDEFPDADVTPSSTGKRSLGKALWFGLLKLTGFRDKAFKLRKVTYTPKGKVVRNKINLLPSVDQAKKVLVVIHGIIGDTKPMLANLNFLLSQKKYDLLLSFDYENLNEPIEKIAQELNKQLEKYGIGKDDGKTVDILAHSMGGLVSRYMIEQIQKGDNTIDQLFMFGTPNGGSVFGDIPGYRDVVNKLLTIALNYGKTWLGPLGTFLDVVNKTLAASKFLTVTLAQMSPTSPFIENLYKNSIKGHTKYTIVAGDTTTYRNKQDKRFSQFMETFVLKVGNVANSNVPNDIAVLVEQIKAVPPALAPDTHDICCHHLNYFEEGEGLETLKQIISE